MLSRVRSWIWSCANSSQIQGCHYRRNHRSRAIFPEQEPSPPVPEQNRSRRDTALGPGTGDRTGAGVLSEPKPRKIVLSPHPGGIDSAPPRPRKRKRPPGSRRSRLAPRPSSHARSAAVREAGTGGGARRVICPGILMEEGGGGRFNHFAAGAKVPLLVRNENCLLLKNC